MMIGQICNSPAPGRAQKESFLDQIRFIHILDGPCVLSDSCRQSIQTYRTPCELIYNGRKEQPVCLIQTISVYFQKIHSKIRYVLGDPSVILYLGKICYQFYKLDSEMRSNDD